MSELEKVRNYIDFQHMLKKGDSVIVGLSGGADSVCLTQMLCEWKEEYALNLCAVHVHHGIRGDEADRDLAFVRAFCDSRGICLRVFHYNIPAIAAQNGISEEEAGRDKRYEAFYSVWEEKLKEAESGRVFVAVAHNADDSVETFLHHLCRGSGLPGLTGIRPVSRQGTLIRPLLCLTRQEIEHFLEERGISFQNDSTNATEQYTRNKIRNRLVPFLREEINRGTSGHILETAADLRETEDYLEDQTRKRYETIVREIVRNQETNERVEIRICRKLFDATEEILKKRLLRMAIGRLTGHQRDITRAHIVSILDLSHKQSGRRLMLPYHLEVRMEQEDLVLFRLEEAVPSSLRDIPSAGDIPSGNSALAESDFSGKDGGLQDWQTVTIDGAGEYRFGRYRVSVVVQKCEKEGQELQKWMEEIKNSSKNHENVYTKWFDYDRIKNAVQLRTRQAGDYLTIDSRGRTKKLKAYLIDEKIPVPERDSLLCVAEGRHILWVCGYRISEYYKISEKTKTILKISVSFEDTDPLALDNG